MKTIYSNGHVTHWHPDQPTAPEPVKEGRRERTLCQQCAEHGDECLNGERDHCPYTKDAPPTPPQAQGTLTRLSAGWVPSYNDPDNASGAPVAEPITESEYIATLERKLAAKDAEIARLQLKTINACTAWTEGNDAHAVTLAQLEAANARIKQLESR